MTKSQFVLIFSLFSSSLLFAQGQKSDYFQQEVHYNIDVELNTEDNTLHAQWKLTYINNSPDSLYFMVIHLWPNAYKDENTSLARQMLVQGNADMYWATEEEYGFIDSLEFKQENQILKWHYDAQDKDICYVHLKQALAPGDSTKLSTPFRVQLPSAYFSRMGVLQGNDFSAYMVSQWYPKPAVYESSGWMAMPYLNQGEFYSEFGTFKVAISVPKDYKVAASGDLVLTEEKPLKFSPTKQQGKCYTYFIDKTHDFAWFSGDTYTVKSRTIQLPSGKEVLLQAYVLPKNAKDWSLALDYMEKGLRFYSEKVGEYPWNVCTAVDGSISAGGGMEYPTITVIGESGSKFLLESTIIHEIGHNWFYGILGFNERDFPWLDEGLNTFYQSLYEDRYMSDLNLLEYLFGEKNKALHQINLSINDQYYYSWLFAKRKNNYQNLGWYSDEYSYMDYGISVYLTSALYFRYLQNYLGENVFDSLMQGFYEEWKFKHPQPEDFIRYFTKHAPKDIEWFFDDFFFEDKEIDYAISRIKKKGDSLVVRVKNKGDLATPFDLHSLNEKGESLEKITSKGFRKKQSFVFSKQDVESLAIDPEKRIPDFNRNNNQVKNRGVFSTLKIPRPALFYSKPLDGKNYFYLSPAMAYNSSSKFMLGGLIYNDPVFERRWEFQAMPLYSFRTKNLNGEAALFRNFYGNGDIRKWNLGISARQYDYDFIDMEVRDFSKNALQWYRLVPQINFYFQTPSYNSSIFHHLQLRWVHIAMDMLNYQEFMLYGSPNANQFKYNIWEVKYNYENSQKVNPYKISGNFQANEDIIKTQISYEQRIHYSELKWMDVRLFAGKIIQSNTSPVDYSFKMSSWTGADDYMMDYVYIDRGNWVGKDMWSNQMTLADGGFAIYTPLGRSWDWLTAVNVNSAIPLAPSFFHIYANAGLYPNTLDENKAKLLYEGGLLIRLIDKHVSLQVPLFYSQEIRDVNELNGRDKFFQHLRFTLRMDLLNPFKWLREM